MQQRGTYYAAERLFHGEIDRVMGTRFELAAFHTDEPLLQGLWRRITAQLDAWDRTLNRFSAESEVSRLAALQEGESLAVSESLQTFLSVAQRYYALTDGLFDITLGRCDFPQVKAGRITRHGAAIRLDFGGIAKGYALRWVGEMLTQAGITQAFVDFGRSSILGLGHHPFGACWQVEVQNPYGGGTVGSFSLRDEALSTSGNTPTYGGHIVRPDSGKPCTASRMVAVKSRDALDAEVLSTVWMIADEVERKRIAERFDTMEIELYKL